MLERIPNATTEKDGSVYNAVSKNEGCTKKKPIVVANCVKTCPS